MNLEETSKKTLIWCTVTTISEWVPCRTERTWQISNPNIRPPSSFNAMQFRFYSSLWSSSVPSKTLEKTKKKKKQSYEPITSLWRSPLWNPQWEHLLSSTNQRETESKKNEKIKDESSKHHSTLRETRSSFFRLQLLQMGTKQNNSRHTSHTPSPPPKKPFQFQNWTMWRHTRESRACRREQETVKKSAGT